MPNESSDVIEFKMTPVLERYYNEDTGWGVFNFTTYDNIPEYIEYIDPLSEKFDCKIKKMGTIVGKMQHLYIGSEYLVKGNCQYNSKYNEYQYIPQSVVSLIPKSIEEQKMFLSALTSPKNAENILSEYPNVIAEVIDGKLKDIEYDKIHGVGKATWSHIREAIINNYVMSDIITMLQPLGVTFTMIKKLLSLESNSVLLKEKLNENPYIMTRVHGLGFKRVDDLALKIKPEIRHSLHRLTAFVIYFLQSTGENNGHTWVYIDALKNEISDNVPECIDLLPNLLKNNFFLYIENDKVGLRRYRDIEEYIFNILTDKHNIENTRIKIDDSKVPDIIHRVEEQQGFQYTQEQINVINNSLHNNLTIISGKAGTGKTSITKGILTIYKELGYSIKTCALSAKAAQRIVEATGYPSQTIHRMLGAQGLDEFTYNKDNPLKCDVVLVDECSMINAKLFLDLLLAIDYNTRIIMCGDHMQLPPIGYGNVFSDILHRKEFNSNQLMKPMRQARESGILSDANLIRNGISPLSEPEPKIVRGKLQDMYYMFRSNREALQKIAIKTFLASIETDGLDEVVIITPRKKDCINSSAEINKIIQEKLLGNEKKEIAINTAKYKLGAKVMQIVNNYEKHVFNGEIGYITAIGTVHVGKDTVPYCDVTYPNNNDDEKDKNKMIRYTKTEIEELELAYALTCHKVQGSGYSTVIGIIDNTHYTLLDNCMLYTLITRAKKRCCILAEPQAFMKCIKTNHNTARCTWLSLDESIRSKE